MKWKRTDNVFTNLFQRKKIYNQIQTRGGNCFTSSFIALHHSSASGWLDLKRKKIFADSLVAKISYFFPFEPPDVVHPPQPESPSGGALVGEAEAGAEAEKTRE